MCYVRDVGGYSTGEWESRDRGADKLCTCKPIEDFNVNVRNTVLRKVLASGKYPNVVGVPFYELTRPRWRWHFGNWCALIRTAVWRLPPAACRLPRATLPSACQVRLCQPPSTRELAVLWSAAAGIFSPLGPLRPGSRAG